jgi:metal-sulfur cluster biosynthetic enzyme
VTGTTSTPAEPDEWGRIEGRGKGDSSPVEGRVWDALGQVRDPELDEPVTSLGFVQQYSVDGGRARVRFRLPTYYCAPNFVWMMVVDAYEAVLRVDGVERAEVGIEDHFASDEINRGLFGPPEPPGDGAPDLDSLRGTFRNKAYMAAMDRVCRTLRREGVTLAQIADMTIGDVRPTRDRERLIRCRVALGVPVDCRSALLLDEHGHPIRAADLRDWLRRAQTVRVSIEGNTELCQALLRSRHHLADLEARLAAPPFTAGEKSCTTGRTADG